MAILKNYSSDYIGVRRELTANLHMTRTQVPTKIKRPRCGSANYLKVSVTGTPNGIQSLPNDPGEKSGLVAVDCEFANSTPTITYQIL